MFGLRRNAVIGLNFYCGGAGLGAGSGAAAAPGGRLLTAEEASARREAGGGEAGAGIGGSAGASPSTTLAPDARRVARPAPIGAEVPDVTGTPTKRVFFAPTHRAPTPDEMEAAAAGAIMSPEEELDGYEPEPLGKRPAVLPLLELVGEASKSSRTDGSLPSTPPPAEEEDDELYRQSLEIICRYLREQATGAKDAKPLGGAGAASRKALETLRRVGDGVQRNHETAFQGWVCGVLPCRGPRRQHQKCAAGFCRCCWSRSWFGISHKIAI
ncbi:PREDICTED: induced myeloid leukemia cell differentiation protein Mcl-1 isoform X2 [Dipodomys ordii]|uniref:Induced myeloid leukemia cell differentiation protein Mcl-1 isoform X2 n=1 Tax=Dipodomys ordii TaxID=10020 RepID=A0A1S3F363_DIPOR|nr:PREDICTED: induced myeloid leukemia cell differentiation protein Mcl-1 isoform X2 [Dipodomys ordii]